MAGYVFDAALLRANVPAELLAEPRWVCWKLVPREGGKMTKLPFCARSGRMAKSTDPATWCGFEEAAAAVGRIGASGVGFVFGPDRRFTGLDLDHVLAGGRLADAYRPLVNSCGTYVEVSPSGDGVHAIFLGSKPEGAERCRRGPVEMYDHDRFFTVTGMVFERHSALGANPRAVERAYRTWIEPELGGAPAGQAALGAGAGGGFAGGAPGGAATGALANDLYKRGARGAAGDGGCGPAALTDEELLDRMCSSRNGAAIRELLDGDLSAYGGDHSKADMALCSHLAFWCAGDVGRMDRIFRGSGLMRRKWDSRRGSATYGEQTLQRAVRQCREFYDPGRRGERGARGGGGGRGSRASHGANVCSTACADTEERPEPEFDPDRAPSVEGWAVPRDGSLWVRGADGEPARSVSSTAPWVACDLVDVDTRDVRALVRLRVPGAGVVERAFDRDVLLSTNRIIGALAPMGGNVSSSNCKDVIRYLTDCERRLGRLRPRVASVTHLGWADGPLGAFMPYDVGGGVRFDPSPDEEAKARPFMEPAGTLDEWIAGVGPAREASPAFRCVLAASFASPLVAVVGAQAFIVYLWGRSRSGKTPTLKAAGSVWGDPTEGADSYFRTFADTPKSIVRAAALLHSIPLIIDELQSKGAVGGQGGKRQMVEDLLYSLSIGHERGALNADRSMMRAGSWRCLTIATGEIPIVGGSTQQGAANRTLELNAEPFGDVRAAQAMHHLVACQYGTAGRTYVRALRGNTAEWYREELAGFRGRVAETAGGHPQADNVALLALADALASFYVFGCGEWDACVRDALAMARWALGNATGAEAGDTDLKAIQFVAEWLERSRLHFEDSAETDRLERWGQIERHPGASDFTWCVFSSVLDRALAQENYDRQKTLRRMDDEGLLVRGGSGRRFTRQRRLKGGNRIWCVCIDNDALVGFLGRAGGCGEDGADVAVGDGPAGVAGTSDAGAAGAAGLSPSPASPGAAAGDDGSGDR